MKSRRGSIWRATLVGVCVMGAVVLGLSKNSEAGHVNLNIGLGIPLPGVVAAPPVVVAPAPVVMAAPPPVVVAPAPVVVAPYGGYYYRHYPHYRYYPRKYYRHYRGHHHD
jgi:hypothetical protein